MTEGLRGVSRRKVAVPDPAFLTFLSLLTVVTLSLAPSVGAETVDLPFLASAVDAGVIEASFDGHPAKVVSTEPLAGEWRVDVVVDAYLVDAGSSRSATDLLATQAEALGALGTTEVLVTRGGAEVLVAEEGLEFGEALDLAGDEGGDQRASLRRSHRSGLGEAERGLRGEEEALLVGGRLDTLLTSLWDQPAGPRAVFWVSDGFDLDPASFWGPLAPEVSVSLRLEGLVDAVGRALAARGCWLFPMALDADLDPASVAGLERLATTTGGRLVRSASDLEAVIADLRLTRRVRLSLPDREGARPEPRALRLAVPGGSGVVAGWATAALPAVVSEARARRVLEEPSLAGGELAAEAVLIVGEEAARGLGRTETLLRLGTGIPGQARPRFRITWAFAGGTRPPLVFSEDVEAVDLEGQLAWLVRRVLPIPEELDGAAMVIDELGTGRHGAASALLTNVPLPVPGFGVAVQDLGTRVAAMDPESGSTGPAGAGDPAEVTTRQRSGSRFKIGPVLPNDGSLINNDPTSDGAGNGQGFGPADLANLEKGGEAPSPILLVPPRSRRPRGKVRIEAFDLDPRIERVRFRVDGQDVGDDRRRPFSVIVDIGTGDSTHVVEATAYGAASTVFGQDRLTLNPRSSRFEVQVAELVQVSDGVRVSADVQVPPAKRLAQVTFYWNEEERAVRTAQPFEAVLDTGGAPTANDYVRVVAQLTDGTSLEDVRLLAEASAGDRVDVQLVEIFAFVSDRDGKPIENLRRDQVTVRLGKKELPIERFEAAKDIPLTLGLAIDTSRSMLPLMLETRQAASRFLAQTLTEKDQAFLVDFDTRPRLAQPKTKDLMAILGRFASLRPGGATALFDATLYSLLQLSNEAGRGAVVVLTDGVDVGSRFGLRRVVALARRLGVPIYGLDLGALDPEVRPLSASALDTMARQSGGQSFQIHDMAELPAAYAQIEKELRSQYLIVVGSERPLNDEELDSLKVEVEQRGVTVRTVIGQGQL